MTGVRSKFIAIGAVVVVGVSVGVVYRMSAASSATATTYSLTVAGTDAHSLDPTVLEPVFKSGGGVSSARVSSNATQAPYLEVGLNLPTGAKVTSVAVTYKFCPDTRGPVGIFPYPKVFYFGSYSPSTQNTIQNATLTGGPRCEPTPRTLTTTGNPITTTLVGRRYVVDMGVWKAVPAWPGDDGDVWYGATVKYTCTTPCVP